MAKVLSRKVSIYINGKEVVSTISSLQSAMTKLQHEQKRMTIGSEEYVKASLKIKEIKNRKLFPVAPCISNIRGLASVA